MLNSTLIWQLDLLTHVGDLVGNRKEGPSGKHKLLEVRCYKTHGIAESACDRLLGHEERLHDAKAWSTSCLRL